MIWDEPQSWGPEELTLDPFTVAYRGSAARRKGHRNTYHLDPACPLLGDRIMKTRLGSMHAGGWKLCEREANPFAWNCPDSQAELRHRGRMMALQLLEAKA
jgi:hypothetical protein